MHFCDVCVMLVDCFVDLRLVFVCLHGVSEACVFLWNVLCLCVCLCGMCGYLKCLCCVHVLRGVCVVCAFVCVMC